MGLFREALDVYRHAITIHPRDWQLIGEAAQLVGTQLRDPAAGLELARAALHLNPWYSPFLWNVLGDCLAALDRHDEAQYLLLPAANNPVYGLVMSIEPTRPGGQGPSAVKYGAPSYHDLGMNYAKVEMSETSLRPTGSRWRPDRRSTPLLPRLTRPPAREPGPS